MKTPKIKIPIHAWRPDRPSDELDAFCRRPAFSAEAEAVARKVLDDIRRRGDAAVCEAIHKYEKRKLTPAAFRVSPDEIAAARRAVDADFRKAARESDRRIARFARAGLRRDWSIGTPGGGRLGERFEPLARVGAYIPGGEAPLVSTALMTITLARVAGVKEIVACSPGGRDRDINPYILFALDLAGATEIYRLGGIQAIGAMAIGTPTIAKVQKIVGPGGPYVTAAKRLVYGEVDLDLVAGPSEVAILADGSADPRHLAADLLSQLEHGTGHERALLVTTSKEVARRTAAETVKQAATLSRAAFLLRVLPENLRIAVVRTLEEGADLCNRFAAEHLELICKRPRAVLKHIRGAGAVFLGSWTPECAGDFVAGPSHVLPTGGTAAVFSGLTVESFRRRTSVLQFTQRDLRETRPVIEAFGRVEQLDGHARSAAVRFES
jgi:histidinol dehydrogenase